MKKRISSIIPILILALISFFSCQEGVKVTAIGGKVVNGIDGQALPGVTVSFSVPPDYFKEYKNISTSATSDANGRWYLSNLPPKISIRLAFQLSGYKTHEMDILTPDADLYQETSAALYLYFTQDDKPNYSLTAKLIDAKTGLPVADAAIHLEFRSGTIPIESISGSDGVILVSGLAREPFKLNISKEGYGDLALSETWCDFNSSYVYFPEELIDDLGWCGDLNLGNITIGGSATLHVEVADTAGNPLPEARVTAVPDCNGPCPASPGTVTTDANGSATFSLMEGLSYSILVVGSGANIYGGGDVTMSSTVVYLGIQCLVELPTYLHLVSNNDDEDSAGGVLKLVFDQPVQVGSVGLTYWDDNSSPYTLSPNLSGSNTGATATTAYGGYQVLVQPLLQASSGLIGSNDEFCYSWSVKSIITNAEMSSSGYCVYAP